MKQASYTPRHMTAANIWKQNMNIAGPAKTLEYTSLCEDIVATLRFGILDGSSTEK